MRLCQAAGSACEPASWYAACPHMPHTLLILWSFPWLPSQERDALAATAEGASRLRFKSQELTQVLPALGTALSASQLCCSAACSQALLTSLYAYAGKQP